MSNFKQYVLTSTAAVLRHDIIIIYLLLQFILTQLLFAAYLNNALYCSSSFLYAIPFDFPGHRVILVTVFESEPVNRHIIHHLLHLNGAKPWKSYILASASPKQSENGVRPTAPDSKFYSLHFCWRTENSYAQRTLCLMSCDGQTNQSGVQS